MADDLVVGFDGTPGARAAAAEAMRLAKALDARVVFAFAYWTNPAGGDVGDMLDALRELGEAHLAEASRGREERRRGARRPVNGRRASALVELARQLDPQTDRGRRRRRGRARKLVNDRPRRGGARRRQSAPR